MYGPIPTFMDPEVWPSNPQVIPKAHLWRLGESRYLYLILLTSLLASNYTFSTVK